MYTFQALIENLILFCTKYCWTQYEMMSIGGNKSIICVLIYSTSSRDVTAIFFDKPANKNRRKKKVGKKKKAEEEECAASWQKMDSTSIRAWIDCKLSKEILCVLVKQPFSLTLNFDKVTQKPELQN